MFIDFDSKITITKAISAIKLLNSPVGSTTLRNNRERWAIILKTGGKTVYTKDGREILSDMLHPVILPKGCSYSWKCTEPGECILIEFDALEKCDDIFSTGISDNTIILKNFVKIEKLLNEASALAQTESIFLIYETLLFLMKSSNKKYTPKDKAKILQPAIEHISQSYYKDNITNDFLAKLCKISTVHFRKTFDEVYGLSPIKYLNRFRIEKAKSMLLSDYDSIGQIAESVGYNSIYHFSKMFKMHTGASPSEYKNTHQCQR